MHQNGLKTVQKTYNDEVQDNTKLIFEYKNGDYNYIEAIHQPFDEAKDGNFIETNKGVNLVLYNTFKTQMPDAKLDTVSRTITIDNLEFQSFRMRMTYPNKMVLNFIMTNRLFGKEEFSLNIIYLDKDMGDLLFTAWLNSKFGKS